MRSISAIAAIVLLSMLVAGSRAHAAAGGDSRFRLVARPSAGHVEWVTVEGDRRVLGSGRRIQSGTVGDPLGSAVDLELNAAVSSGVLVGGDLFLARADGAGLAVLDPDGTGLRPVPVELSPRPLGALRLGRMVDHVLVAEDGVGLRIVQAATCHGTRDFREIGFLSLDERFTAVAASGGTIFLAVAAGDIAIVDASAPERPVLLQRISRDGSVRAMAANGPRLHLLGDGGLEILDLSGYVPRTVAFDPGVRGRSLVLAGRTAHVAAADRGLLVYRDSLQGATTHFVTVGNNFFSPQVINVDVGDSVRWSNSTLVGHNVFSCIPSQVGCGGGTSTETFGSGSPSGFWVYTHTFTQPGVNPYVCQPHAAVNMIGSVRSTGAPLAPPGVPDGSGGTPLRVGKQDPAGSSLLLEWDTSCTGVSGHSVLYGGGSQLPASPGGIYALGGAECSAGTTSPFTWNGTPDAAADPTGLLWWVMTARNSADVEGPWGTDSALQERDGPGTNGSSAECGVVDKDLGNGCGQ